MLFRSCSECPHIIYSSSLFIVPSKSKCKYEIMVLCDLNTTIEHGNWNNDSIVSDAVMLRENPLDTFHLSVGSSSTTTVSTDELLIENLSTSLTIGQIYSTRESCRRNFCENNRKRGKARSSQFNIIEPFQYMSALIGSKTFARIALSKPNEKTRMLYKVMVAGHVHLPVVKVNF